MKTHLAAPTKHQPLQQQQSSSTNGNSSSVCLFLLCPTRRRLFFNLTFFSFVGLLSFVTFTRHYQTDLLFSATNNVASATGNYVIVNSPSTRSDRHNFRQVNRVITEYDPDVADRLTSLVDRKATSSDSELIRLIRDMMDPPSDHMVKMSRQLFETPQSKEADAILKHKRAGFFIECGGFDGERASNTLWLERQRGWTGLLVEMDPFFYTQLIGKSRHSWSINACLSPHAYVTQQTYVESSGGAGELASEQSKPGQHKVTKMVPCFPLDAILVALNQTTVDYFSLDVEGFELDILKTIPFDQLDIKVLSVEYVHGRAGKQAYTDFMAKHGYVVHKDIHFHDLPQTIFVDDFIFVKR